MYFDRYDIVVAHYLWCCHYHSGQGSQEYLKMCRITDPHGIIRFNPSPLLDDLPENENQAEIYADLCIRNGYEVPQDVQNIINPLED
jgi:hypothetical protein